jgi:hypothetical protein
MELVLKGRPADPREAQTNSLAISRRLSSLALVAPTSSFVFKLSLDTPTAAAALLGRLIPVSMVGTLDGTIIVLES